LTELGFDKDGILLESVNESNNDFQRESLIDERQKEWKMEFEKG